MSLDDYVRRLTTTITAELQAPIEQSLHVLLGEVMEKARQDREEAVGNLERQLATLRADFQAAEARAEAERQSLLEQHAAALTALRDEVTAEVGQAVLAEARQMALEERAALEEQVRAQCLAERQAGEQELMARLTGDREAAEHELRARLAAEQEAAVEELRGRLVAEHEAAMEALRVQLAAEHETATEALRNQLVAEHEAAMEELRVRLGAEHEAALQALRDELIRQHEQQMLEVEEGHQRALAQLRDEEAAAREAAGQSLRAQLMAERERSEQALRARLAAERDAARPLLGPSPASDRDERLEETRVPHGQDEERLAASLRQLDTAVSLTDVLGALLDQAATWSGRAALFLAAGERVRGWRQAGFDGDITAIDLPLGAAGPLGLAVQTGDAVAAEDYRTGETSLPLWLLPAAGQAATAVPIGVGGRPVAVLYCDGRQSPPIEILARHAARCLEVLTISRATSLSRPLSVTSSAEDVRRSDTGPESDSVRQEESARRYARLLISELKLYNEAAVEEGRKHRDLLARLGPEVERARRLYEEKIPAAVRQRASWFDEELVRTLADGDASMLGQVT